MSAARRVAIVGVDCLTPQLLFDRFLDELPTFARLASSCPHGTLRSTVPPITVPAWMCMATSQDPGQLGLYGFRNRVDHGYGDMRVADATWLPDAPSVWQLLSRRRRRSLVVGVPLTYPARPILGDLVAGLPVPDGAEVITQPPSLRAEIDAVCGDGAYPVDVKDFRTAPRAELLERLHRLRETRFDVVEALAAKGGWDLLFMVEMGVDRLHHAFWADCHPDHPRHDPHSPFRNAIRDYYVALDRRLGRFLDALGDDTAVLVVSDHGARTMKGGVRFNEWLVREGLLSLARRPARTDRLRLEDVDWAKTSAWADGGYYARVFLNVAGREPRGVIGDLPAFRASLKKKLEQMRGPDGAVLGNRVFVPEETFRAVRGVAPDLIVFPGDLALRANATVLPEADAPAHEAIFSADNDTGADGANHAVDGIVLYRPARGDPSPGGVRVSASLYDVAPTALRLLGETVPDHMIGAPMPFAVPTDPPASDPARQLPPVADQARPPGGEAGRRGERS